MQTLSEFEMLAHIMRQEPFEAEIEGGAFVLKVDQYQPAVCTAVHAGHRLRADLADKCTLTAEQRRYEEDPHTDEMTSSFPITLIGKDSRYEYDLNRPLAHCVYQRAWNKQVWAKPLTKKQITLSREKHKQFYRVLDALLEQLERRFKCCIIFDFHSFNYQRIERATPVFNIGTEQIDMDRWRSTINLFQKKLAETTASGLPVSAAQNDAFQGRGYLIGHVNSRHVNSVVIPTEVKKIFMDETTGELFPPVLDELKTGIKHAITETKAHFIRKYSRKPRTRRFERPTKDLTIGNVQQSQSAVSGNM